MTDPLNPLKGLSRAVLKLSQAIGLEVGAATRADSESPEVGIVLPTLGRGIVVTAPTRAEAVKNATEFLESVADAATRMRNGVGPVHTAGFGDRSKLPRSPVPSPRVVKVG